MPIRSRLLSLAGIGLLLGLQGCGGGGGAADPAAATAPAPTQTLPADAAGMRLSRDRCSGTAKPALVRLPMDESDYAFILPYGLMVGGHVTPTDHQYFSPTVFDSAPGTYPVYAVADSDLHEITTRTHPGQRSYRDTTIADHRLVFSLSCRLFYYYDLVTELAPGLAQQLAASGGRLRVQAGQLIGRIGNQTLDFAVWDTDKPLANFLVPEHYGREPWKLYTADPLDYYDAPTRALALAKYVRSAEPPSGRIDFDVDGRLIGNWFRKNADGSTSGYEGDGGLVYWGTHLALAPHYLDPSAFIISIGNWPAPQGASQFVAAEAGPDPAWVDQASGLVKYTLMSFEQRVDGQRWSGGSKPAGTVGVAALPGVRGCLLVQLVGAREIQVQTFVGSDCSAVGGFTAAALRYVR